MESYPIPIDNESTIVINVYSESNAPPTTPILRQLITLVNLGLLTLLIIPGTLSWLSHGVALIIGDVEGSVTTSVSWNQANSKLPASTSKPHQRIAEVALEFIAQGGDYKPGEKARCQDFVNHVTQRAGWRIPSTQVPIDGEWVGELMANRFAGADLGTLIWDSQQLQMGDLVFWADTYGNFRHYPITRNGIQYTPDITHVGIYVGDGKVVDRGSRVRYRELCSFKYRRGERKGECSFVAGLRLSERFYQP